MQHVSHAIRELIIDEKDKGFLSTSRVQFPCAKRLNANSDVL